MTREEAMERIKARFDKWALDNEDTEAIQTLIPELAESEDERMRKEIIKYFKHYSGGDNISVRFPKWIAYLEKQKELPTNEEMLRTLRVEYEKGVADTIAKYEQREQKPAERPSWKPSEEQIGALDYAYCELFKRKDVGHNILGPLQKLCDELKKLGVKEEPEYYQHFDPDC